ncbi:MAG: hypothetical protein K0R93_3184 [Anaerosolibacter sp.]|jgi:uncharacterized membrane protein YdcZ (DUF606 family)|uniref:DMT family transporter n=1 Tax=Anaerosolibacter sp. TaxID=1872527 RepID=UPI002613ACBF|nr:DMT family transporter [Anaerosolibacter sp.]MDF2548286.1 hypothetical protein [Anaerosolibacter sp.]
MIYIGLSFLTGITIVINMMLNGKLAQKEGLINGVMINYFIATLSSIALCIIMIRSIPIYSAIRGIPLLYLLGGFMGVLTTYMFNVIVPNLPAVYVVILRFIGQMLASAMIDYIYLDIFSRSKIIGGILFLLGLIANAKVDRRYTEENLQSSEDI